MLNVDFIVKKMNEKSQTLILALSKNLLKLKGMLQETWNTFPLQVVQKINGLLDQAQPNSLKAFQIYKMCQAESLWDKSFSEFSFLLESFYQIPLADRTKSQMDQFLNRPMDCVSFESVHLTFRTADIRQSEIRDIASWAHHMLRLHYEKNSVVASVETLSKTIFDITHPGFDEKDHDILSDRKN